MSFGGRRVEEGQSTGPPPGVAWPVLREDPGTQFQPLVRRSATMLDTLFIVVTIAFFAITIAYTAGCERL